MPSTPKRNRKLYIRTRNDDGTSQLSGIVYQPRGEDGKPVGKRMRLAPGDEVPRDVVSGKDDPILAILTNTKPAPVPIQGAATLDD